MLKISIILFLLLINRVFLGDLCDFHVFNWNFFLNHNKDLLRSGIRDMNAACNHFRTAGAHEGRQAHPRFHSRQYCEIYEDLRNSGFCSPGKFHLAVNHYLDHGISENREGYHKTGGNGIWTIENNLFTISASAVHGGAISSIIYKDTVEIVNSYDHGRELQFAFTDSTGECNNPTEGGSGNDGIQDHTTSILEGIRVEPGQYIATTTRPAYWKGPEDPCTRGRGRLSPFHVAKQVTMNYNGNPHLIAFDISFTMALSYDILSFECPTLYMPSTFDRVYAIEVGSRSYYQIPLLKKNLLN